MAHPKPPGETFETFERFSAHLTRLQLDQMRARWIMTGIPLTVQLRQALDAHLALHAASAETQPNATPEQPIAEEQV